MSISIKDAQGEAQACMIWMHGLGTGAYDMMALVDELSLGELAIKHVFLDAPTRPVTINGGMPMSAWYDIVGFNLADREDKNGIQQSAQTIRQTIAAQLHEGMHLEQIYLAGFSQGGAMALYSALTMPKRLGGVIALSAYLPLASTTQPVLEKTTPIFMGSGQFDPMVLPAWTQMSQEWLLNHGYNNLESHQYPMEHSICLEEVNDLSAWLTQQVLGVSV